MSVEISCIDSAKCEGRTVAIPHQPPLLQISVDCFIEICLYCNSVDIERLYSVNNRALSFRLSHCVEYRNKTQYDAWVPMSLWVLRQLKSLVSISLHFPLECPFRKEYLELFPSTLKKIELTGFEFEEEIAECDSFTSLIVPIDLSRFPKLLHLSISLEPYNSELASYEWNPLPSKVPDLQTLDWESLNNFIVLDYDSFSCLTSLTTAEPAWVEGLSIFPPTLLELRLPGLVEWCIPSSELDVETTVPLSLTRLDLPKLTRLTGDEDVDQATLHHCFFRGLANMRQLYMPLCDIHSPPMRYLPKLEKFQFQLTWQWAREVTPCFPSTLTEMEAIQIGWELQDEAAQWVAKVPSFVRILKVPCVSLSTAMISLLPTHLEELTVFGLELANRKELAKGLPTKWTKVTVDPSSHVHWDLRLLPPQITTVASSDEVYIRTNKLEWSINGSGWTCMTTATNFGDFESLRRIFQVTAKDTHQFVLRWMDSAIQRDLNYQPEAWAARKPKLEVLDFLRQEGLLSQVKKCGSVNSYEFFRFAMMTAADDEVLSYAVNQLTHYDYRYFPISKIEILLRQKGSEPTTRRIHRMKYDEASENHTGVIEFLKACTL